MRLCVCLPPNIPRMCTFVHSCLYGHNVTIYTHTFVAIAQIVSAHLSTSESIWFCEIAAKKKYILQQYEINIRDA